MELNDELNGLPEMYFHCMTTHSYCTVDEMTKERHNITQEWEAARTVIANKQAHSWTTRVAQLILYNNM